jgi:secondary thiamine-phosphate synthase enzyme
MKIITEQFTVNSRGNCDIIDITDYVNKFVQKNKFSNGNASVFSVGSTASISTIEYEPGLKKDLSEILDKLIPSGVRYNHDDTWGDHNGHAHLRSTIIGCSQIIPFQDGELLLGTWQQIVLIDFDDRPRVRKVVVQLIGE